MLLSTLASVLHRLLNEVPHMLPVFVREDLLENVPDELLVILDLPHNVDYQVVGDRLLDALDQ